MNFRRNLGKNSIRSAALALAVVSIGWFGGGKKVADEKPAAVIAESGSSEAIEKALSADIQKDQLVRWCSEVRGAVGQLKWKIDPCVSASGPIDWRMGGVSVQGRPLLYAEFGDLNAENTTLILSTVHGDEITPLFIGLRLAHWLKEHGHELGKTRVVIAPLVNPDGFFSVPKRRMNARGVDINRNFATQDWEGTALKKWKVTYRSDPRRFPGKVPRSEPETLFQEELIRRVKPQKILSVHSPLNHLDYDGPSAVSLSKFPREYVTECLKLRKTLNAVSTGFFPGSLGNYAGRELGIPTLTLELPSANAAKAEQYWKNFSKGIRTMIEFAVPDVAGNTETVTKTVGS